MPVRKDTAGRPVWLLAVAFDDGARRLLEAESTL